jgi:phosphate starvation-inducible PhoH-like protein
VINGDITQVDLPQGKASGLREAELVLRGVSGISMFRFGQSDVVRHPLVQKIVHAYDRWDTARDEERAARERAAEERRTAAQDAAGQPAPGVSVSG